MTVEPLQLLLLAIFLSVNTVPVGAVVLNSATTVLILSFATADKFLQYLYRVFKPS